MLLSHKQDLLFNLYYLVGFRLAILVTLAEVHFTAVRIKFYTLLLLLGPGAQQYDCWEHNHANDLYLRCIEKFLSFRFWVLSILLPIGQCTESWNGPVGRDLERSSGPTLPGKGSLREIILHLILVSNFLVLWDLPSSMCTLNTCSHIQQRISLKGDKVKSSNIPGTFFSFCFKLQHHLPLHLLVLILFIT